MKKTFLIGGAAALTLIGGVAAAQQARPEPAQALSVRGDTDADGRLSRSEFVARRVDRLAAADADRDGSVGVDERRAARDGRRDARRASAFDRLDADRDGVLTRAEFQASRAAAAPRREATMRARAAREGRPVSIADARAKAERAFARLDADRDGFVTVQERRAGRRDARLASPRGPASE